MKTIKMTKSKAEEILIDISKCNNGKRNCVGCSLRDYGTNCIEISQKAKEIVEKN